jgi:hypothetical protein
MSRGPGRVQRAIFKDWVFGDEVRTTRQLASLAYPGVKIERKHLVAVRRALKAGDGLVRREGLPRGSVQRLTLSIL